MTPRDISDESPSPEALVDAAEVIADGLGNGGRLLVDGVGRAAPDARHIVVEFMHPVTVGKRALPALEGLDARRSNDVTISIAYGGSVPTADADVVISDVSPTAPEEPTTNSSDDGPLPAVEVWLPAGDPNAAKVAAVLSYHVMWELVHVFLEAGSTTADAPSAAALYPMLYPTGDPGVGGNGRESVRTVALASAAAKVSESADVVARTVVANRDTLERVKELLGRATSVFTFGNGGSSTDAASAAMSIGTGAHCLVNDVATITALANDVSFDVVFARQLAALGAPGDAVIAFSTSGNSKNLIEAATAAKRVGMSVIGFAGYDGGAMASCPAFDELLVVESDSVHRIQEAQSALMAALVADAE